MFFILEVRFPESACYPSDPPLVCFSTPMKDFPSAVCLKITYRSDIKRTGVQFFKISPLIGQYFHTNASPLKWLLTAYCVLRHTYAIGSNYAQ
jgi:hypothetical protein